VLDSSSWWFFRWYWRFCFEDEDSALGWLFWLREGGMADGKEKFRESYELVVSKGKQCQMEALCWVTSATANNASIVTSHQWTLQMNVI
jgi:hypothetical protein